MRPMDPIEGFLYLYISFPQTKGEITVHKEILMDDLDKIIKQLETGGSKRRKMYPSRRVVKKLGKGGWATKRQSDIAFGIHPKN